MGWKTAFVRLLKGQSVMLTVTSKADQLFPS